MGLKLSSSDWVAKIALLALFPISMTLQGCSPKTENQDAPKAPIGNIQFDNHVTQFQRDSLAESIDLLDSSPILQPTPELLEMMKIQDASSSTLRTWLEDRVQYILPTDFRLSRSVVVLDHNFSYPNISSVPVDLPGPATGQLNLNSQMSGASVQGSQTASPLMADQSGNIEVLMSNLGAEVYLFGKYPDHFGNPGDEYQNLLLGVKVKGVGTVPIRSPRAGLLQLGNALFIPNAKKALALKIFRLSVLFHEARHSDGSGAALGFVHAVCPSGDYQGATGCDRAANGPYSLQAEMLQNLIRSCASCTAGDIQSLQLLYFDTLSRLLNQDGEIQSPRESSSHAATTWDDTPEGYR